MMQIYKKIPLHKHNRVVLHIVLILLTLAAATVKAQSRQLFMGNNALTIEQAFSKIEQQTTYVFAYSKSDFDKFGKIRLVPSEGTLKDILSQVLSGTGFSYQLDGNHIIIGDASGRGMEKLKTPTSTLSGSVVCSSSYQPLESAAVELAGNSKIKAITDKKGNFELKEVPLGDQTVRVSKEGYIRTEATTSLSAAKNTTLKITVDKEAAGPFLLSQEAEKVIPYTEQTPQDTIIQTYKETLYLDSKPGIMPADVKKRTHAKYALKTNLLYLGTTTPNISFETALAKKWTLDGTLGYNPWDFSPGKVQHGLAMAEARYWTCQSFEGHFFGLHGIYSEFNVGELSFIPSMKDYTYKGNLYGGGISYGYHFPLKGRWAMEVTAGVGYIHLNYDKYECKGCNELLGSYKRNYWGPTKAGISLIYIID